MPATTGASCGESTSWSLEGRSHSSSPSATSAAVAAAICSPRRRQNGGGGNARSMPSPAWEMRRGLVTDWLIRCPASINARELKIPLSAFGHPAGARERILATMQGVPDPSARSILLLDDDPDVGIAAQLLLQRRLGPVHFIRRPGELVAA